MSSYNIQRQPVSVTIDVSENTTVGSTTDVALNGILRGIQVNAPDLDSTNTYTVAVETSDGFAVFSKASIAKNVKTSVYLDSSLALALPLSGTHTIKITASGVQSVDRAFTVYLLVDRG